MSVEVEVKLFNSERVTMECPLCKARIVRDRKAFIAHMVVEHSAVESTFDTAVNVRRTFDSSIRLENNHIKYPIKCYGCGSTFTNLNDLLTHLMDEHNAV